MHSKYEKMKTVSVVMCTYNGAEFIREQLDSIISQTYPIYELIIQDDCSTDETVAIIKEYMEKYSFIKLYINEHNLGFNQNFKNACMKASGDFVAISDQDDVWFPEKLEKQVAKIGYYDICCSPCLRGYTQENSKFTETKVCFERQLFCGILGHTMLCRRSFIQHQEYWLPSIYYDWSLSLHGYLNNGIIAVEEPLNLHREHASQATNILHNHDKSTIFSPYIKGYSKYRELQRDKNWQFIYTYLRQQTKERFPLVHQFCDLLLKDDFLSFLRLCLLCCKHRDKIYPRALHGIKGYITGAAWPLIHAYFSHAMYKDLSLNS